MGLAGQLARLDVNDARATANRAVLHVRLALAPARVDVDLFGLAAEWALQPQAAFWL
jgi:hypothetical protein